VFVCACVCAWVAAHVHVCFNVLFIIEPLKYFSVLKTDSGLNVSACSPCFLPR
jgi:hypothetical protein